MVKKILAAHDISCFGRCSMQVAVPVLSHYGLQVCPLPTALLSTHTGGFDNFTFLDLTDECVKIAAHWESLELKFDAIYSGFLANEKQIDIIDGLTKKFSNNDTVVLVDPVMGDNGLMYKTYNDIMCSKMEQLCKNATIITPNLTEAYILTKRDYNPLPSGDEIKILLKDLIDMCETEKKAVIISGVHNKAGNEIGVCYYDNLTADHSVGTAFAPYCDKFFPGCGDLLASMLLGKYLKGGTIKNILAETVEFISRVSFITKEAGTPGRDGVIFEEMICSEK